MNKKYLIITLLALAALGASCSKKATTTTTNTTVSTNTNTTSQNSNTTGTFSTNTNAPVAATVIITSAGISSTSTTVAAGTVVTFLNNDTAPHQIASNPHPSHTDLPGFDLTLSAGSSQSFTFTKIGSWGYHDHNNPFATEYQGRIIVQ